MRSAQSAIIRRQRCFWDLRWCVAAVWLLFIVRALFYAVALPMWEGFDEWSHVAYIDRVAFQREILVDRTMRTSREIDATFPVAPLPWLLRSLRSSSLAHEDWWRLPVSERSRREQQLRNIPYQQALERAPAGEPIYEALQPPLYYWLAACSPAVTGRPLLERVFALRLLNVLIASAIIPIGFVTVLRVTGDAVVAVSAIAMLSVMPELCIDVARVSNEALAIVLFSTIALLGASWEGTSKKHACRIGAVLGLGLLTKAYFLVALAAVILLIVHSIVTTPRRRGRIFLCAACSLTIAIAISGWWYIRNRLTTGTWTGLSEAVALRDVSPSLLLSAAGRVDWANALDSILVSHLWFGGWSALTIRSWMYHLLFVIGAFAATGALVRFARRRTTAVTKGMFFIAVLYGLFWFGEAYNVVLIFLTKHASTSMGWYLYAVVVPEVAIASWGLAAFTPRHRAGALLVAVIALFAALDLYGMHFLLLPYYTGYLSHRANGTLMSFHLSQIGSTYLDGLFARVSVNRPAWVGPRVVMAMWAGYFAATIMLVCLPLTAAACIRRHNPDSLQE